MFGIQLKHIARVAFFVISLVLYKLSSLGSYYDKHLTSTQTLQIMSMLAAVIVIALLVRDRGSRVITVVALVVGIICGILAITYFHLSSLKFLGLSLGLIAIVGLLAFLTCIYKYGSAE